MKQYEVIENKKHPMSDIYHHFPIGTIVETDCRLDFFDCYICKEIGGNIEQSILPKHLKEI